MAMRILLVLVIALGCRQNHEQAVKPRPFVPPGSLVIQSRSIPAETAMRAVGLRTEEKRDTGDASWRKSFTDVRGASDIAGVRRDFTLVVANESAAVRRFTATIEYVAPDGTPLRTRKLNQLVVPPFAENTYFGYTVLNPPGAAVVTCHLEMIDGDEAESGVK